MIGIVLVSHSARLAEGVRDMVDQMTQGQVSIALAGGIDDPENPIGTDAGRVHEAIEEVYSEDGVLVLMDLGSAMLSTEMALEFLTEEQRANVHLCSAPIVEGAMAASVQIATNNNLEQAMAEANSALRAKMTQLGLEPEPQTDSNASATLDDSAREITLTIRNHHGLHARPAARFVSTIGRFQAEATVRNISRGKGPVNSKSINQVATLGVRRGDEIGVAASGADADQLLAAIKALVADNFGESETAPEPSKPAKNEKAPTFAVTGAGALSGIAVAPGIAIGPAVIYQPAPIEVPERTVDDPQAELQRLHGAIEQAQQELEALRIQAASQVGSYEASIFEAHQRFLDDPVLVDAADRRILEQAVNAEAAWQAVIAETVDTYQNLDDDHMQARATDVADVGRRVLKLLTGVAPPALDLSRPSILVAVDLTPSDTAQLNPDQVLGICTELGSATSHSAILARALGIPAVVGLGAAAVQLQPDTTVALNGKTGQVWIDPEEEQLAQLKAQREQWLTDQQAARAAAQKPAQTQDGQRVEVVANIGGAADVKAALESGAEGVGLFRTEFLYLDRTTPPTEAEQLAAYTRVAEAVGDRPLVIRTLDIGGDKQIPYMDLPEEENPFLGWRGIRLMLDRKELFKTQLRAILQASPGHQFKVMFPMVSSLAEVQAAKAIWAEAQAELQDEGLPFDESIEIGIMIEVPATATIADQLAVEVDFFSIGTNDLSQYTMAADRTNPRVSALPDAFQPAVLRLIQQTIKAAHEAGIWVGLCGEFAGDPLATPILLGLGLDEFSMSAPAIPTVKQALAQLTVSQAQTVAQTVLTLSSAAAVKQYVESHSQVSKET